MLGLLSPGAPSFDARAAAVGKLSDKGIDTVIRFDPILVHLFQALCGASSFERIAELLDVFASIGARHITASTGRLSKRGSPVAGQKGTSTWQRIYEVIYSHSLLAARKFEQEYIYEAHWSGGGYRLRRDLRVGFHRKLLALVEARGMTYATCQELSAEESDSQGLPHCEGLPLPFAQKQADGKFKPIPGCTANCHVSCRGLSSPPCGQAGLVTCRPLRLRNLRLKSHQASLPCQQ
jgi:hypothetical protein